MTDPDPNSFDDSSMSDPGDGTTVADIRRAQPTFFQGMKAGSVLSHLDGLQEFTRSDILYTERLLAKSEFEKVSGRAADAIRELGLEQANGINGSAEEYQTYGVAKGNTHTEQLVRDIESHAAAHLKRRR